jgi:hypothetical protein
MLASANTLVSRYETAKLSSSTQRPFDVREYTTGVKELSAALEQMNLTLKSSDQLLASPEWERRIKQLSDSADGRMAVAVEQSRIVTNRMFFRLYVAIGVLFVLLILYRLIGHSLSRRLKVVLTPVKPGGNGHEPHAAVQPPAPPLIARQIEVPL